MLRLAGDRKAFPYLQSEFDESDARLSPDGRWLAYVSDESKRKDVFVQTFPTATGKWQVSINGGQYPVWSRDGKQLYFLGGDRMVTAVDVKAGPVFDPGAPTPLFEAREAAFDVGSDGRFLMTSLTPQAFAAPMTVVVNWPALLKRR